MTSTERVTADSAAEMLSAAGVENRRAVVFGQQIVALTGEEALKVANELRGLRELPPMSTDTLLIYKDNELLARVEDYLGPVPHVGDHILHPRIDDDGTRDMDATSGSLGPVIQIALGIYARPGDGVPGGPFTGRQVNTIQVYV